MTCFAGKSVLVAALMGSAMLNLRWTGRHTMPTPVAGGASGFLGDRLIYAGGTTWNNDVKQWLTQVHMYDSREDKWTPGPSLPVALAYGAFANPKGSLLVLGGTDGTKTHRECW